MSQTLLYFEELIKYGVYVYMDDIKASKKNPEASIFINLSAILYGLLRCAYCGGRMRRKVVTTKYNTYTSWLCNNYETYGKTKCSHRNMLHEKFILDEIKRTITHNGQDDLKRIFNAYLLVEYGLNNVDINYLQDKVNELNHKIDLCFDMYATGDMLKEDYNRRITPLTDERKNFNESLLKAENREALINNARKEFNRIISIINNLNLDTVTNRELKDLLTAIIVDKEGDFDNFSFIWNFSNKTNSEIIHGAKLAIQKYKLMYVQYEEYYEFLQH